MDFRDFLSLGSTLANGPTEADWRSASSRAYYAAFHVARQLLSDLGFTVPRADSAHAYLTLRLTNSGDVDVIQAGSRLNALRGERNIADYDDQRTWTRTHALRHVLIAEEIIQALDAAAIEPVRTQITDTIKVYERDILKRVTYTP